MRKRVIEAGQRVSIIEQVAQARDGKATDELVELKLLPNAHCVHLRLTPGAGNVLKAGHHARLEVSIAGNASYTFFELLGGIAPQKSEVSVSLLGPGASCTVSGLMFGAGDTSMDVSTRVMHMAPNTTSRTAHRGVFADNSKGSFVGSVFVDTCAQKTNAFQENKNLLLSDSASVFTKPELEINADDVQCSHGATVGHLSEEALFYMRSRGVSVQDAERMLVQAFVSELLFGLTDPEHMLLARKWLIAQDLLPGVEAYDF